MPAPLRDVPDQAVDLIKAFEGIPDGDPSTVNIDAYLCPAGIWTIGWGHAIVDNGAQLKGPENKPRARALYPGGITVDQAVALLRGDLVSRAATVSSLVKKPIDANQYGALIALVFNIGGGNLAESSLLRLLNAGDMAGAADQFLAWDKARVNGVLQPLAGLTRRRRAERALFLGQDWRAAGEVGAVTRGRAAPPPVLPVPEAPEPVAAAAPAKKAARKAAAKPSVAPVAEARPAKEPAKTAPKKTAAKSAAKKAAAKTAATPPARTTRSKAPPPAAAAKRPAPKKAR